MRVWRNGFGWVDDPWAGVTGGAGPYNPSGGSGSGGGAGITGGASGSGGGAGITGAGGSRPRSGVIVTGDAGPYDPFPWITGEAGPYDPWDGVTGDIEGIRASGGGDNQMSWAEFFSGNRSLLAGGVPEPPTTNLTPYIAFGLVALVVVVVVLKK